MRTAAIARVYRYWGRSGLAVLGFLGAASISALFGQATPTITAVDYELPVVVVSPGQIITLFVAGVGGVEEANADKIPLPTELAGFQVFVATPESPRTPAPILAVKRASMIAEAAVTVQIPYEILAVSSPQLPTATYLVVSKDGVESASILVLAWTVEASPRVVKRCESRTTYRLFCTAMITHADGSLVTAQSPAKPGEVLVMYALGLGRTIPPTQTGAAPAQPLPIENVVFLYFDYSENAGSKLPGSMQAVRPLYVGAVAGFVGLYQINFQVPPAPPGTPPCSNLIQTNLTVNVAAVTYDGAGICVQP